MTTSAPILSVRSARKRFKDVVAVDGLSIDVRRGEFVALLGPNGAGKTTLVEMIEGIQRPDSGEIELFGLRWSDGGASEKEIRRRIGISLQETRFFDRVTTIETLSLFGSFYGATHARCRDILKRIRLEGKERAYVQNLSGGQRQRLALGVALLGEPELLLLDEPTTGLDPNARRDMWEILEEVRGRTTLLLTTHYMEEAERLCERIVVMDNGRILAQGTLAELRTKYGLKELIEFRSAPKPTVTDAGKVAEGLGRLEWDAKRRTGRLVVESIADVLPTFLARMANAGIELEFLESRRMTLDDLFVYLTGRRLDD